MDFATSLVPGWLYNLPAYLLQLHLLRLCHGGHYC